MAIKVGKKKAQIGATVMDYYQVAAEDAMRGIYDKIHSSPALIAKDLVQKKRGEIARLNSILTTPDTPGKGVDLELTRLRGIDFYSIDTIEVDGDIWFVAQTKDLKIQTVQGRGGRHDRYAHSDHNKLGEYHDLGDYKVYFPKKDLASPVVKNIHFVPDRRPDTPDRHFHHRGTGSKSHPVKMNAHSCWGGFAEPVAACMEACDLPDLFRILRIFVGRRNPQSLLVRTIGHEEFHDE